MIGKHPGTFLTASTNSNYFMDKMILTSSYFFILFLFPWTNFLTYIFLSTFFVYTLRCWLTTFVEQSELLIHPSIHTLVFKGQRWITERWNEWDSKEQSRKNLRVLNFSSRPFFSRRSRKLLFLQISTPSHQRVCCGFYFLLKWKHSFLFDIETALMREQITIVGKGEKIPGVLYTAEVT